jgi:hypothetical protein
VLVGRGTLDLDAPLQRYCPEMVSPATVREVLAHRSGRGHGLEVDLVVGGERSWGLGVSVEDDGWGMGGTGGSTGWWCTEGGYAAAHLTSHVGDHGPATAVEKALRDCLGLPR